MLELYNQHVSASLCVCLFATRLNHNQGAQLQFPHVIVQLTKKYIHERAGVVLLSWVVKRCPYPENLKAIGLKLFEWQQIMCSKLGLFLRYAGAFNIFTFFNVHLFDIMSINSLIVGIVSQSDKSETWWHIHMTIDQQWIYFLIFFPISLLRYAFDNFWATVEVQTLF